MPKMDGISATSLIRQFDHVTPIISMTSNSRPNDIMTYYSSGMNDILPKPFTKEGLLDMLEVCASFTWSDIASYLYSFLCRNTSCISKSSNKCPEYRGRSVDPSSHRTTRSPTRSVPLRLRRRPLPRHRHQQRHNRWSTMPGIAIRWGQRRARRGR